MTGADLFRRAAASVFSMLLCLSCGRLEAQTLDEPEPQLSSRAQKPKAIKEPLSVLPLLPKETPKPNYGVPVPAKITGRVLVHQGEKRLPKKDVSITDGYSVTTTDARGRYELKPHAHAVFLYITRPAGHDVRGPWYKPLASQVHFDLKPAAKSEDEYIFVHVTDTHVSQNQRSLRGLSRFVREVNSLSPQPRFVVNSGDLLNLHKALTSSVESGHRDFRNYVGIMNHLAMPYYNVAGDHTDSQYRIDQFPRGDHRCGKPLYWEYLGPHFFSFEYGKIHFVSVDFGYHLGKRQLKVNGKMLEYPTNQVQPMHVNWLGQDMKRRSRGTFVVTTSEADLHNHCPGFTELARSNDVRLQLVGDNHVVAYKERPVPYRSGGALAGCWWNPKTQQLCPDLSPQGYLIYRVKGERLEHFYKGLGQRVGITSHRVGAVLRGRVAIQAHLVQPALNEHLEYSLDGKRWARMRVVSRPFYRTLYQAEFDTTTQSDGRFEFRVRSSGGEARRREFVVANGRDPRKSKNTATLRFDVGAASSWTTTKAPTRRAEVLLNGKSIGILRPGARTSYSFKVPAMVIQSVNVLAFHFDDPKDGMTVSSPILTLAGRELRDPRDAALRKVKQAHWGAAAGDWGGYIVGAAAPPDESPFHRRQNVFCFIAPSQ